LQWAGGLRSESLRTAVLEKLVTQFSAEQLPEVKAMIEQNFSDPTYRSSVGDFAQTYVEQSPEAALTWLEALPPTEARDDAVLRMISSLSAENPSLAVDWLSRSDIFTLLGGTGSGVAVSIGKNLYDEAVQRYIESSMVNHPGDALASVDAVQNAELRERLRQEVMAYAALTEP
jgi:hypothetical protein